MPLATKEFLMRYLLGDLSEDEEESVEREYFARNKVWNALSEAEDDLICAYLHDELSALQKRQFQSRFLTSPRNQEKVALAEVLMNPSARERLSAGSSAVRVLGSRWKPAGLWAPRWLSTASVGLAVVFVFVAFGTASIILARQNKRLHDELAKIRAEQKPPESPGAQRFPLAYLSTPMISRILMPDLARGGNPTNAPQMIPIASIPSRVSLALSLERDECSEYGVLLETAEGKKIFQLDRLSSQLLPDGSTVVVLNISSDLLRRGEYVAKLSGKTPDGGFQRVDSYIFSAVP